MRPDLGRGSPEAEAEAEDAETTIDFGGWPAALILPPVMVAFFAIGMGLPLGTQRTFSILYLGGAIPVAIGVIGSRRRGTATPSARVVRGLGWVYLVGVPIMSLVLALG